MDVLEYINKNRFNFFSLLDFNLVFSIIFGMLNILVEYVKVC